MVRRRRKSGRRQLTHIKETHIALHDGLLIGCSGVSVVEDGTVLSTAADAGVGHVPCTAIVVAVVLEYALQLVLRHARPNRLHHLMFP